jgi:hypothetical protein
VGHVKYANSVSYTKMLFIVGTIPHGHIKSGEWHHLASKGDVQVIEGNVFDLLFHILGVFLVAGKGKD